MARMQETLAPSRIGQQMIFVRCATVGQNWTLFRIFGIDPPKKDDARFLDPADLKHWNPEIFLDSCLLPLRTSRADQVKETLSFVICFKLKKSFESVTDLKLYAANATCLSLYIARKKCYNIIENLLSRWVIFTGGEETVTWRILVYLLIGRVSRKKIS